MTDRLIEQNPDDLSEKDQLARAICLKEIRESIKPSMTDEMLRWGIIKTIQFYTRIHEPVSFQKVKHNLDRSGYKLNTYGLACFCQYWDQIGKNQLDLIISDRLIDIGPDLYRYDGKTWIYDL